jgi:HEAT repeat protein
MAVEDLSQVPTPELVERTLSAARHEPVLQSHEYWAHVRVLHFRSGQDVFEAAVALCASHDAISRAAGADILAQLGVRDGVAEHPFAGESESKLVPLLRDTEPMAIASALYACGHLGCGEPTQLAALARHPAGEVRCALAYALGGRTDAVSTATLIELCADEDVSTRDWAAFALGSLSDEDSPAIRDALASRLIDADDGVRSEAIVGLARRGDDRAVEPLLQEIQRIDVGKLALEAAGEWPRSEFIPCLEALQRTHAGNDAIAEALNRCREAGLDSNVSENK